MNNTLPRIAITAGEPAGIGPDLCVLLARKPVNAQIIIVADRDMLLARAAQIGVALNIQPFTDNARKAHCGDGTLTVLHIPVNSPSTAGELNTKNSEYVLETLRTAASSCVSQQHKTNLFDAMVTAPVHKGIINDAGICFSGHTEFLAELTDTKQVVMMLVSGHQAAWKRPYAFCIMTWSPSLALQTRAFWWLALTRTRVKMAIWAAKKLSSSIQCWKNYAQKA